MKKIYILIGLIIFNTLIYGQIQDPSNPDLETFKILAEKKADQFRLYLIKISSKSTSLTDKQTAISQACDLFISDTVLIQVSYCNKEKSVYSRKLIDYLKRLSQLNYDLVTIEWVECAMVEQLHKAEDGNYYGIISFVQKFTATKGENTYYDVTRKHMEVVLKPYKKPNDLAEEQWVWEIFLSNVSIKEPCL
jgi:hypothetical protein